MLDGHNGWGVSASDIPRWHIPIHAPRRSDAHARTSRPVLAPVDRRRAGLPQSHRPAADRRHGAADRLADARPGDRSRRRRDQRDLGARQRAAASPPQPRQRTAVPARRRGAGRRQAEPHPQSQHPGAGRVGTGNPRVVRRAGPVVMAVAPVPEHRAGDLFEAATEQQRGGVPQPRPRRLEPRRPGPGVGRHRDEVGAHVRPFRYLGRERPLRALRARPRRVRRQRRGAAGPGRCGLRRQWPVRRSRSAGRARPRARPAAQAGPQLRPRCPRGQRGRRRAGPAAARPGTGRGRGCGSGRARRGRQALAQPHQGRRRGRGRSPARRRSCRSRADRRRLAWPTCRFGRPTIDERRPSSDGSRA